MSSFSTSNLETVKLEELPLPVDCIAATFAFEDQLGEEIPFDVFDFLVSFCEFTNNQ